MAKQGQSQKGKTSPKDTITGLSLTTDGYGLVISDRIYGPGSSVLKNLEKSIGSNPGNLTMEFELGKDKLVHTTKYLWDDGKTVTYQRIVAEGVFGYTKGKMTSAEVTRIASHNSTLKDGAVIYEDAWAEGFNNPRKVTNLKSSYEWNSVLNGADFTILEAEYANNPPTDPYRRSGDMSAIDSFGGGGLLQAGWWGNPFASNLI